MADVGVELFGKGTFDSDGIEEGLVFRFKMGKVSFFELTDVGGGHFIKLSSDTSVQHAHLFFSGHWHELFLLEQFSQFLTSVQKLLGGSIEVRSELSESGDFSVLGELQFHGTSDLLHGFNLGSRSDSRHGKTDVNGWSDTSIEELSF